VEFAMHAIPIHKNIFFHITISFKKIDNINKQIDDTLKIKLKFLILHSEKKL